MSDDSLGGVFHALLEQACTATSPNASLLTELDNAVKIAGYFAEAVETSPPLVETISRAMSTREGQALLCSFIALPEWPPRDPKLQPIPTCLCAFQKCHLHLQASIRSTLLRSGLRCSGKEQQTFRSNLVPLLDSNMRLAQIICSNQLLRTKGAPVSLFETVSTPQTISISHGWKDEIAKQMSRDAQHRSKSIIRMVGEICRDLELRCNDAERPLREEQSKSCDLKTKLDVSEARVQKLEADIERSSFQIRNLEHEKESSLEQVRSSEHRLQDLCSSLDKVQEELRHSKANAQQSAEIAAESARQQDLAYLAMLTGKEEILEEQASKLAACDRRAQDLEDSLVRLRSQEAEMVEKAHVDCTIIEDLKKSHLELCNALETKEADLKRLVNSEALLSTKLGELSRHAEEAAKEHDSILTRLKSQILTIEAETMQLREEHRQEVAKQEAAFMRLQEQLQLTVNDRESELQQAHTEATESLAARDIAIAELESQNEVLKQERQARAREFAEAQDLSRRLMAIVGTKQPNSLTSAKRRKVSRSADNALDDSESGGLQGFQEVNFAKKYGSVASVQSTRPDISPTPDRAKTSRHATSPLMSSGKAFVSVTGHRRSNTAMNDRASLTSLVKTSRTPKQKSMASRPRQSKVPRKISSSYHQASKSADENTAQRPDSDESFEDADTFTSTNQQDLLASHIDGPSTACDETTADL